MEKFQGLQVPNEAKSLWLLPIEPHYIHTLRRDHESVMEFVVIWLVVGPHSSWRSTTAEIYDIIVEFSHRFAPITFRTGTKDLP